jgi:hypothetical protein
MRTTIVVAGAALVVLAAASLIVIRLVEPSPGPAAAAPPPIPPEVTAAVAAAREAALREAEAKQAAADAAAREIAAKEAAARRAAVEAAAREVAAKEAAAREAADKEAGKEPAKEHAAKDGEVPDASAAAPAANGSGSLTMRTTGGDAHLAREGRPSTSSGAPARGRDLHGTASIAARLDELKPRLAQCYEGAQPGADPPGGSPAPESERPVPPVFLLELESSGEHYRIVDANVDSRGGAEDAVLECMQTVLMNSTIPTQPGPETVDRVALRFSP